MNQLFKSNKGFTLVEILIAVGLMSGIALVMMQITKDQANQMVKNQVFGDIASFKTEVSSIFTNPAHCNANFIGLTAGTSHPAILKSCDTTIPNNTCFLIANTRINRFPVVTAAWGQSTTKIADKIRMKDVKFVISPTTASVTALSSVAVEIDLESKPALPVYVGGVPTYQIKQDVITFTVPVVMNGSNVLGCPKTWNSTVPFGGP
ncbi:MAG: prepilin-type N-terminal cleavage/methylation domain-containing protein [Rhizobacter sp.]|nr:prepilin-type N-terminal cleavage/methylation domain-containing protein [Bacteriovorax sp.]